ncbi:MAG: AraC family transcriptional regulator [Bacteroidota bacterium]
MSALYKQPDKGDPSDVLQLFPKFDLQLLCCRKWLLSHWEFSDLSYPYWRIYHNGRTGACMTHDGREITLQPHKLYMIAPNTSYSTRIGNNEIPKEGYLFEGKRIQGGGTTDLQHEEGHIPHLFIHFNIGGPYDNISPGIFEFDLTPIRQNSIQIITSQLVEDFTTFSFHALLALHSLISDLLSSIPASNWNLKSRDHRILKVLGYIEASLNEHLSNRVLAGQASLATNAFNRLFTEEVGVSPQKYVKKKRIDRACALLHHSDNSIDQVAADTGFADRYHFSKSFKQVVGLSPARYRKAYGIK